MNHPNPPPGNAPQAPNAPQAHGNAGWPQQPGQPHPSSQPQPGHGAPHSGQQQAGMYQQQQPGMYPQQGMQQQPGMVPQQGHGAPHPGQQQHGMHPYPGMQQHPGAHPHHGPPYGQQHPGAHPHMQHQRPVKKGCVAVGAQIMAWLTGFVMCFLYWQAFVDRGGGISRREAEPFFYASLFGVFVFVVIAAVAGNAAKKRALQPAGPAKPKKKLFGGLLFGWIFLSLSFLGAGFFSYHFYDRADYWEFSAEIDRQGIKDAKRELKKAKKEESYQVERWEREIENRSSSLEFDEKQADELSLLGLLCALGAVVALAGTIAVFVVWRRKRAAA